MTRRAAPLAERFRESLTLEGAPAAGTRLVVAVSGGLDSCVLLHLLRFEAGRARDLVVAHFDHALRPESADDALWVRGLATAWGVPFRGARAAEPPRSEASARDARYAFLERVRVAEGARAILTAHHADDQAETVLFRVLRGTGITGLAGIPGVRDGRLFRPLLAFWRAELEAYAERARLTWRTDASNAGIGLARNAIRHRLLPDAERLVAQGAREALVRLARTASVEEAAWAQLLEPVLAGLDPREDEEGLSVDRAALRALHPGVRARALRALTARLGLALDEVATRSAVALAGSGRSGAGLDLGGGLALRLRLDRVALVRPRTRGPDRTLSIPDAGPGRGDVWLGGARIPVWWGAERANGPEGAEGAEPLRLCAGQLPVLVRGRRPGDRIRLPGGSRKLKKVLLDARIPPDQRARVPVVADASGQVLWVPGVARAVTDADAPCGQTLFIGIG